MLALIISLVIWVIIFFLFAGKDFPISSVMVGLLSGVIFYLFTYIIFSGVSPKDKQTEEYILTEPYYIVCKDKEEYEYAVFEKINLMVKKEEIKVEFSNELSENHYKLIKEVNTYKETNISKFYGFDGKIESEIYKLYVPILKEDK